MVLPSSNLQPEAIINILQKEKNHKGEWSPNHLAGGLSRNEAKPTKKLVLKEYLGGSALPKSLIEGFDKDFGIKGVQAWE
jgi:fatty-acyl-CoA synthase